MREDGKSVQVDARGGIPSRERALGDHETTQVPSWQDQPGDAVWTHLSPEDGLRASDGSPRRLRLTTVQKSSLVAFLGSLTDSTFLTAARFSNPFVTMTVGTPSAGTASVSIQANSYRPPSIAVQPGTVITYTNLDNSRHSAQFDNGQITSTPIFSTGSRTVTMPLAAGTYTYHCAIHGLAMSGVVVVR